MDSISFGSKGGRYGARGRYPPRLGSSVGKSGVYGG